MPPAGSGKCSSTGGLTSTDNCRQEENYVVILLTLWSFYHSVDIMLTFCRQKFFPVGKMSRELYREIKASSREFDRRIRERRTLCRPAPDCNCRKPCTDVFLQVARSKGQALRSAG